MGFRLTLPGGAVVECESAEDAAKLLAAIAATAAPAAPPAPSSSDHGRGARRPDPINPPEKLRYGTRGEFFEASREHFGVLAPREARAVELKIAGRSTKDIAAELGKTPSSTSVLLNNARRKLEAARAGTAPGRKRMVGGGGLVPTGRGFRFRLRRGAEYYQSPTLPTREEALAALERYRQTGEKPVKPKRRASTCTACNTLGHRATNCPQRAADAPSESPAPAAAPELVHYYGAPEDAAGLARCGADGDVRIIARRKFVRCPACIEVLEKTDEVTVLTTQRCSKCGEPGHTRRVCPSDHDLMIDVPPADRLIACLTPLEVNVAPAAETFEKDPCAENTNQAAPLPPDLPSERQTASSAFESSDEAAKQEVASRARGPRLCRRCHQPGHRSDTCDLDLTAARLQDIAAAAVRLGLAPPPEPRAPLPVRAPDAPPAPPAPSGPRWDRDDPDQDLTDLDLGVPELPAAPPVLEPAAPAAPVVVAPPPFVDLASPPDDAPEVPSLERARRRLAARSNENGPRAGTRVSVTLSGELTKDERDAGRLLQSPPGQKRPRTRGDCGTERPCPFVSCSQHLYLDVNEIGNLVINDPQIDVWEMGESCALDVADRGEQTLEDIATNMGGLARERVRQIEELALLKIRRHSGDDLEQTAERRGTPLAEAIGD